MATDVKFDIRGQNKTKTAFNQVKRDLKDTQSGILSLNKAMIGIGAAVGGIYALAKGISVVTEAAMVQREAEAKLASVIKATGGAAGKTLEELKQMASAMQNVTVFGDEMILSGMSILATFKNIRGDAFERTTRAALDMSTVMKQDLKSSMVQLGKALNDPITGLSSLSRVGVTFTEQQKELIKTLQESGDLMGAQSVIFAELESQFGGAAENLDPFQKALGQLKNTFGDVLESIGFAIVDNEIFTQLMISLKGYLEELIPVIGELIQDFVDWLGPIDEVTRNISDFIDTIDKATKPLRMWLSLMGKVAAFQGKAAGAVVNVGESIITGRAFQESGESAVERFKAIKASRPGGSLSNPGVEEYALGTGPAGLPDDGLFKGHKGEVVLSPGQSNAMRNGSGGNTYNFNLSTMIADAASMRAAMPIFKQAMKDLDKRWS